MAIPLDVAKQTTNGFFTATIAVGTSPVPLAIEGFIAQKGVTIQADAGNTAPIYVGPNQYVSSTNGFKLAAGESISIEVEDPSAIWVVAGAAGQSANFVFV